MSTNDTYLAVFLGHANSPRAQEWNAMSVDQRKVKEQQGMIAWQSWMEKYHSAVVYQGGPLGKTKRVSGKGIADISNEMAAFVVVRASSQDEAAKMFEGHPHFTIFPGEAVEVMPLLPIPTR